MIGDEAIEQAYAPACSPRRRESLLLAVLPGDARDIEVRPWNLVHEALQNLRRGDRARVRATDVLHIRDLGFDQTVVSIAERQAPDQLVLFLSGAHETLRELVIVAEQTGIFGAER